MTLVNYCFARASSNRSHFLGKKGRKWERRNGEKSFKGEKIKFWVDWCRLLTWTSQIRAQTSLSPSLSSKLINLGPLQLFSDNCESGLLLLVILLTLKGLCSTLTLPKLELKSQGPKPTKLTTRPAPNPVIRLIKVHSLTELRSL